MSATSNGGFCVPYLTLMNEEAPQREHSLARPSTFPPLVPSAASAGDLQRVAVDGAGRLSVALAAT